MELITVGEMDGLPDDPAAAFVQLERICRLRLNEITEKLDRYEHGEDYRMEYMTIVASAADAYGVATFDNFNIQDTDQFRRVYQYAISVATRLTIESKQARADEVVTLGPGSKERLRKHLADLRKALEESDLDNRKKGILKKRLDSFDAEIDKDKSSVTKILAAAALIAAALNQSTSAMKGVQDNIIKLPETVNAVNVLIGKEKLREIEAAPEPLPLPPAIAPKPLPAPTPKRPLSAFDSDLDDDVPF